MASSDRSSACNPSLETKGYVRAVPRKGDRAVPADGRSSPHGGLARLFADAPPPGPFRRAFWSSPLRGPWLTAILGTVLLGRLVIVTITGFLSHAAYNPNPSLGQNGSSTPAATCP